MLGIILMRKNRIAGENLKDENAFMSHVKRCGDVASS